MEQNPVFVAAFIRHHSHSTLSLFFVDFLASFNARFANVNCCNNFLCVSVICANVSGLKSSEAIAFVSNFWLRLTRISARLMSAIKSSYGFSSVSCASNSSNSSLMNSSTELLTVLLAVRGMVLCPFLLCCRVVFCRVVLCEERTTGTHYRNALQERTTGTHYRNALHCRILKSAKICVPIRSPVSGINRIVVLTLSHYFTFVKSVNRRLRTRQP